MTFSNKDPHEANKFILKKIKKKKKLHAYCFLTRQVVNDLKEYAYIDFILDLLRKTI
jgi:hypothetical protein